MSTPIWNAPEQFSGEIKQKQFYMWLIQERKLCVWLSEWLTATHQLSPTPSSHNYTSENGPGAFDCRGEALPCPAQTMGGNMYVWAACRWDMGVCVGGRGVQRVTLVARRQPLTFKNNVNEMPAQNSILSRRVHPCLEYSASTARSRNYMLSDIWQTYAVHNVFGKTNWNTKIAY